MRRRVRFGAFLAAGLALAGALAFFVSPQASGEPDGLNRVAIDEGFAEAETDHPLAGTPTAGYAVEGVDDEGLSTGLAGLIGVAVTFAVAGGVMLLARRAGGRGRAAGGPGAANGAATRAGTGTGAGALG